MATGQIGHAYAAIDAREAYYRAIAMREAYYCAIDAQEAYYRTIAAMREGHTPMALQRVMVCVDCDDVFPEPEEAFKHAREGCEMSNYDKVYFSFKDTY